MTNFLQVTSFDPLLIENTGGGGTGTVTSVAGVSPDDAGNVPLTAATLGADTAGFTSSDKTRLATTSGTNTGDQDVSGLVAKSTVTTKGDLFVATASGVVTRLAAGADTAVLTADSTQTAGVKWAAAGGLAPSLGFTTGWYYGMPEFVTAFVDLTMAVGDLAVYPFWLPTAVTISKLTHRCDNSGTSAVGALVVYADNGSSYPGARLAYAVANYTTGNQVMTVNGATATLSAGLVWIGEYVSSATVGPQISAAQNGSGGPNRFVAASSIRANLSSALGFTAAGVTGVVPPATYPSGASVASTVPLIQFAV